MMLRTTLAKTASVAPRMMARAMSSNVDAGVNKFMTDLKAKQPWESEFLQAVDEVVVSLKPLFEAEPKYMKVLPVIAEPERVIQFRVPYLDRNGHQQVNRAFRVQFNSAIGPYKGGLRFHPTVNLGILKFLGFEQIFKNGLTGLPMGGGKGGSDFDPKGKNDVEVYNFCSSFMTELYRHIGHDADVPAGDIGVGGREIGYMMGQYKKITKINQGGVLTGKGIKWGGSNIRPEATGYGTVYFAQHGLEQEGNSLEGKTVLISGSGNVSQYALEKCLDLGAKVVTLSDSQGTIYEPEGFTREGLEFVMDLKNVKRGRISEYAAFSKTASFVEGGKPWVYPGDVALPCATQNEVNREEAATMMKNGVWVISEGANMPSDGGAIEEYVKAGARYYPAKAANAGGVATSGLEMSQNSLRLSWTREEVDGRLKKIMTDLYDVAAETAEKLGRPGDIQMGANAAGFIKVADAMIDQGMCFV